MLIWIKSSALPWLKKHWELFGGVVVAILGFVFLGKKHTTVIAPELVGAAETEKKIVAKAKADIAVVDVAAKKQVADIEQQHSAEVQRLTDTQKEEVLRLRNDPEQLTDYLMSIGKQIR